MTLPEPPVHGAALPFLLPDDLDPEADNAPEVSIEIIDGDGDVLRRVSSRTPEYRAPNAWLRLFPERAAPRTLEVRPGANRWLCSMGPLFPCFAPKRFWS